MLPKNIEKAITIVIEIKANATSIERILLSLHLLLDKLLELRRYGASDTIVADKKFIRILKGPIFSRTKRKMSDLHNHWGDVEAEIEKLSYIFPGFRCNNLSDTDSFSLCITSEKWWKCFVANKDTVRVALSDLDRKLPIQPEGEFYHTAKMGARGIDPKKVTSLKEKIDGFLAVIRRFKYEH